MRTMFVSLLCLSLQGAFGQNPSTNADPQAAYTATITQRAEKIVASLGLEGAAKAQRVRDMLVQQYRELNALHEKSKRSAAGRPGQAGITSTNVSDAALKKLHAEFISKLSSELTQEQVDK